MCPALVILDDNILLYNSNAEHYVIHSTDHSYSVDRNDWKKKYVWMQASSP